MKIAERTFLTLVTLVVT